MIMYTYKIIQGAKIIIRHDGDSVSSFAENPDNTDYQAYLRWLEAGNTPEPAEENQ
jgi:hypothetical protein